MSNKKAPLGAFFSLSINPGMRAAEGGGPYKGIPISRVVGDAPLGVPPGEPLLFAFLVFLVNIRYDHGHDFSELFQVVFNKIGGLIVQQTV